MSVLLHESIVSLSLIADSYNVHEPVIAYPKVVMNLLDYRQSRSNNGQFVGHTRVI